MTIVVSLMNQKGGSCKTTNAVNIADGLAARGFNVLLGDLDEGQDSSLIWSEINESKRFITKGVPQERIGMFIDRHLDDYDYIILDCPPRHNMVALSVIKSSDLVLVPICPSPVELWSLNNIAQTILERQELADGEPMARVLMSRCKKGTKLVGKSVRVLSDIGMQAMDSGTTDLEIYRQTFEYGESVYTTDPEFQGLPLATARKQVNSIVDEIADLVGVPSDVEENRL